MELSALKNKIIARYGSIHAFAKTRPDGLPRSTIYQVLSGKYAGRADKHIELLKKALSTEKNYGIFDVLKKTGCAGCDRKPSARRKRCQKCFNLWQAQEKAILEVLWNRKI